VAKYYQIIAISFNRNNKILGVKIACVTGINVENILDMEIGGSL
jgi:hypothetical protein